MAKATKLFRICSLLMAALFAYSASVQLDDPDWYFWLPLYTCGCVVNLVNPTYSNKEKVRKVAVMALWLGLVLFIKVAGEDYRLKIAGFWSWDLRERVVREKFGSGLVFCSMFLHLKAASHPLEENTRKGEQFDPLVEFGMVILTSISYGLSFVFFVFHKREMKF